MDFQITTTTQWFYPYSYFDCNVGLSYYDIVNSTLCRSYMTTNTLDPIAFLESNGSSDVLTQAAASHGAAPVLETPAVVTKAPVAVEPVAPVVTTPVINTNPNDVDIRRTTITSSPATIKVTTPTISQTTSLISSKPSNTYQYQIIGLKSQEIAQVKRKFVFFIKVYDLGRKSLHSGKLAHRIVLRDTKGIIAFGSPVISYTSTGIIKVTAL